MNRQVAQGVLVIGVSLLSACGSTPRESFYTLSASPSPATAAASALALSIGPVSVPEAVDRTPMVVRTGPHSVEIDEFNRWAEPLKTAIPRVLAENLARELGGARVHWSRQGSGAAVDYRVALEVQRFDSSLDEGATLDALWTLTPSKGGGARTGRTVAREPLAARDYAGIAAAHSRALERLARDIAAAIK